MFGKLIIVLVVAALAVGLAARSSHGAGPERAYVVKPTDTLWSIAARNYAGDVREGVWKLEQRNHLDSATLTPGQVLRLPGS
jgi:LysM repeat protein